MSAKRPRRKDTILLSPFTGVYWNFGDWTTSPFPCTKDGVRLTYSSVMAKKTRRKDPKAKAVPHGCTDGTFPDIPSTTHASGTVKAKALKLQEWNLTLKPKP